MSDIRGLAGVIISTERSRFPAMAAFYTDVMGLTARSNRDGFVNFEWGGQRLTIALHSQIRGRSVEPARVLINLGSADVEADFERIEAAGATVIRRPTRESWGGLVGTVADPDGNLIQLIGA